MRVDVRPWGRELILIECPEFVVKKLEMNQGHCCSLQYHEKKFECFYVLSGKFKFYTAPDKDHLDDMVVEYLSPGDFRVISVGQVHRMEALEDGAYLETATNYNEVVRLQDAYNRIN